MEAIYCACVLANLEGINSPRIELQLNLIPTLSALDLRAQKLEGATSSLLPPPPTAPLTWDSLAWRVARLSNSSRFCIPIQSSPEVPLPPSLDLLERTIEGMNLKQPGVVPVVCDVVKRADEADGDDEKTVCDDKDADARKLDIVRQRLCFAIGKRGRKLSTVPYDLAGTCSLALYFSLEIEKAGGPMPRPMRAMGMPPPPRQLTITKRCRCKCNRKKPSFGSRVGGFFGKLAWWRRKKDDDDSDSDVSSYCGSSTASSSMTSIVDR